MDHAQFITAAKFDALRNAIYHVARRQYYDGLNRLLNFLVIILGAGVAGKAASLIEVRDLWLEIGVLVAATAQLAFDFGYRARTHEILQKKYYEMIAEMEVDDASDLKKWNAKLYTIASDEPMPMRALDALAYNAALDATMSDPVLKAEHRIYVPFIHRLFKHLIAFNGHEYVLESERSSLWRRRAKEN
ncbi:hypothetical protein FLL57_09570 [Rhodopseudomonas palustris]|uniref:hypothetical protein n=1 Tax=Rhodopseudomonas palustris TaxID=1076 RepID=UPI00115D4010|nr:hypothetical protein [Rhodopseudomonas palustris]QDL97540.1 hypothetical protein FLL57_09570 [Rhodopseudomonas palustris]